MQHTGGRPSWDCQVCRQPWPCANAKTGLLAEYQGSPSGLALFMASCMYEVIESYRTSRDIPVDIYDRFLGWVRSSGMP